MMINGVEHNIAPMADLKGADLREANLEGANLEYANLIGANLEGATLFQASLKEADLRDANFKNVNFNGANLQWVRFNGANLEGAIFINADLNMACLNGAKNIPPLLAARLLITPEGELIGWKQLSGGTICKLRPTRGATTPQDGSAGQSMPSC